MNQVRKFLRLTATDRRLLVGAALLLGAIRLGLWLLPFQTLRQLLGKLATIPRQFQSTAPSDPDRIVWGVMTRHRDPLLQDAMGAPRETRPPEVSGGRARPTPNYPERVAWAVVVASRYVPKSTCLTQALTAQVLLARRGFPARLHIGVAKQGAEGRFEAHAWVENQGKVLIGGSELGRYTPLSGLERQSL